MRVVNRYDKGDKFHCSKEWITNGHWLVNVEFLFTLRRRKISWIMHILELKPGVTHNGDWITDGHANLKSLIPKITKDHVEFKIDPTALKARFNKHFELLHVEIDTPKGPLGLNAGYSTILRLEGIDQCLIKSPLEPVIGMSKGEIVAVVMPVRL